MRSFRMPFRIGGYVLSYLFGAVAGEVYTAPGFTPVLFALLLIGGFRFSLKITILWRIAFILSMFLLGVLRTNQRSTSVTEEYGNREGYIEMITSWEPSAYGYRCVVRETRTSFQWICYSSDADTTAGEGSICYVSGSTARFRRNIYPGDFNARTFYRRKGISGRWKVAEWICVRKAEASVRNRWIRRIGRWPVSSRTSSFFLAMLAGDKSGIGEEDREHFADAGIVHILAVSGLHVGLIMWMAGLCWPKKWSRNRLLRVARTLWMLSVLWGFIRISGAAPSTVRAGITFTLIRLAEETNVRGATAEATWYAAFLIALADPFQVFQLGYQLSFLAVFGILYGHSRVESGLKSLFETKRRSWLRHLYSLRLKVLIGLSVSFWAQCYTFPATLYHFHRFPNYFLLNNLIFLPLVPVLLMAGLVLIALEPFGLVPSFLWRWVDGAVNVFHDMAEFSAGLPMAISTVSSVSGLQVGLFFAAILLITLAMYHSRWSLYLFAVLVVLCSISVRQRPETTSWAHVRKGKLYIELQGEEQSVIYADDLSDTSAFIRSSAGWRSSLGIDEYRWEEGPAFSGFPSEDTVFRIGHRLSTSAIPSGGGEVLLFP